MGIFSGAMSPLPDLERPHPERRASLRDRRAHRERPDGAPSGRGQLLMRGIINSAGRVIPAGSPGR